MLSQSWCGFSSEEEAPPVPLHGYKDGLSAVAGFYTQELSCSQTSSTNCVIIICLRVPKIQTEVILRNLKT